MLYVKKTPLLISLFSICFTLNACTFSAPPQNQEDFLPPPTENGETFTPPIKNDGNKEEFADDFIDTPPSDTTTPLPEQAPTENADIYWDVSDVDISYIDVSRKLISFTFDDAPAKTLENILAVFAEYNESNPDCKASATLFCNGHLFNTHSTQLLHAACALGFELGNHSYSHFDMSTLSEAEITWEISQTDSLLTRIDGKARHIFRAPFGKTNDLVRANVKTPLMNWTIDTLDWTGASADEIYSTVFENKFSGGIVLMHDGYVNTVSALKRLLPDLKSAGYQIVSVSALAKAHDCPLRNGGEYIRARKQ